MSFWHNLKKPIIALAPMANVTDAAYRRIIAKYGKPDVMWTEFVSADGLARELIQALRRGVEDEAKKRNSDVIGISVKTRVGYGKPEIEKWILELLHENLDALTIHARTVKELSKVPARWEHVREVIEIRN